MILTETKGQTDLPRYFARVFALARLANVREYCVGRPPSTPWRGKTTRGLCGLIIFLQGT